jgi:hypothetical protein
MREANQGHHKDKGEDKQRDPRHGPIENANTLDPGGDPPPLKPPPYYGGPEGAGQGHEPKGHRE